MVKGLKIALAVATLLTTLAMGYFTVLALTLPHWGLFAICLLLTGGFGYFSYRDYLYFFGKKNDTQSK